MRYSLLLLALLTSGLVLAAPPSDRPPELTPVPDGPPGSDDAPSVTIKPSSQGQVEEYRSNGKLYMLKVTPKVGKPHYLIDPTGEILYKSQGPFDALEVKRRIVKYLNERKPW